MAILILIIGIGIFCYGYYLARDYGKRRVQYEEDKLRLSRRVEVETTLREGTQAEQQAEKDALDEGRNSQNRGVSTMGTREGESLDDDDRVKLETWYSLMTLLEHYEDLTFKPVYQRALGLFATREEKERRALKVEVIEASRTRLMKKWEDALGSKWRDHLMRLD
jgi:hypothetical protein